MDQKTRLFVYGSLRLGFRDPAYDYVSKFFQLLGEGKVKGNFYFNKSHPVAVPASDDSFITGDIYQLINEDDLKWVMVQLDDYEGLNVEEGEIPLYKRELAEVKVNGESISAWIYWFNGSTNDMIKLDASEVAKYLQQLPKP